MSFVSANQKRQGASASDASPVRHPGDGAARGRPQKSLPGHGRQQKGRSGASSNRRPPPGRSGGDDRTDERLLGDYRSGDETAFVQLVQRYQRELFHFLIRFMGNRATAEDIFQETFLQVHQSADLFDLHRQFKPWLFTIAANKARDHMRARGRRPTSPLQASINPGEEGSGQFIDLMQAVVESPGEPMERRELQERVQKTVMEMPEHLREILLLSYFHQFPYKQISEILGVPLGTVKSRLHAAVAHFADRWRVLNQNRHGS